MVLIYYTFCTNFPMVQQPLVVLHIIEASRLHSDTPHSVGLLWSSVLPEAEIYIWQQITLTNRQTSKLSGGIRTHSPNKRGGPAHTLSHLDWLLFVIRYQLPMDTVSDEVIN